MKTAEVNVAKELAALKKMTAGELRDRYAKLYGEPTRSGNKQWLIRLNAHWSPALALHGFSCSQSMPHMTDQSGGPFSSLPHARISPTRSKFRSVALTVHMDSPVRRAISSMDIEMMPVRS